MKADSVAACAIAAKNIALVAASLVCFIYLPEWWKLFGLAFMPLVSTMEIK